MPDPQLTDGVVVLRPWQAGDDATADAGHDDEIARWLGADPYRVADSQVVFAIEVDDVIVGRVDLRPTGPHEAELAWTLFGGRRGQGYATRALRILVDYAFAELDVARVSARVEPGNVTAMRVATRTGLRREGTVRVPPGHGHRPDVAEYALLARLPGDAPITEPHGFRSLLNSFLPRKRAIGQLLVRDRAGRVLTCRLTYKKDWDLPGGVVEVGESPQLAVVREIKEELGLDIGAGPLLLTDWMPSWGGWDDALCLVFDGGVLEESALADAVLEAREIAAVRFCTIEEVRAHCADFTARRVEAALNSLSGTGPCYTESGRP